MLLHFLDDLTRELRADVEHRHDDAAQFEGAVNLRGFEPFDVAQNLAEAFERHLEQRYLG